MRRFMIAVALAIAGVTLTSPRADGRPQYQKAFLEEYPEMRPGVTEAKCNTCHCQKDGKTVHKLLNDYGQELRKELKVKNVKRLDVVRQMMRSIEDRASKGDEEITFGEMIRRGQLPGTCPEPDAEGEVP